MPVSTLDKSPEVRRLIRRIKIIAPHLAITCRDIEHHREYSRRKMREHGAPWLKIKRSETQTDQTLSDQNPIAATGKSVRPPKESPARDMSGQEIPATVARGMAAGLTDKPRGK